MSCFAAELATRVNHANQDHAEQKSAILHPSQKEVLVAERDRVHDNIKRLRQVPRISFRAFVHGSDHTNLHMQESDTLREQLQCTENRARELISREQQIKQDESVEVPRVR